MNTMPNQQVNRNERKMAKNLFEFADKELLINLIFTLKSELSAALNLLQVKKCEYVKVNNKLVRMSEQAVSAENSSESEIDQEIVRNLRDDDKHFFSIYFCDNKNFSV